MTSNQHDQHQQLASKGAAVGILTYLVLSMLKLSAAYLFKSASMKADGLNNLSDIISSILLFGGLWLAKKPADDDHHFGHSKYEAIASFATSFIMFSIGLEVIQSGITRFIHQDYDTPDLLSLWISFISITLLLIAYTYIKNLAFKLNSLGLKASSKDMLNDVFTTFGTSVAIIASSIGFTQVDILVSILIGGLIIKTAYGIFSECTFTLSDGFDQDELTKYKTLLMKHPKIHDITKIRGRLVGSYIYVDVTVKIDSELTVLESHHITEEIEKILEYNYNVRDVDVHVEPYIK